MKQLVIAFVLLFAVSTSAQKIKWITLEEAIEAQKEVPKKIIMDAYTTWCGPCKKMDKETFKNKNVVAYINEHFYAVKFNAQGNDVIKYQGRTYSNPEYNPNKSGRNSQHQLARSLGVRIYPTLLYFDENGDLLTPTPGYQSTEQIELYLKLFHTNEYKNIKTSEDFNSYSESFKPEFSD